ncbi:hypothetical protein FACS189432_03530 [Bacteroidia bacterium]|nr:hypothetical protein FACS189426_06830 [Bacteroidia bacterium]GHT27301.1 hypothetical protein FACS189432_03530 [Bacteroidia bacterium]
MKLDSLVPNAKYDLAYGEPATLKKDNDGSFLYRYNVEPEMGIPDGETNEVQIGWQCREIRIWENPTKGVLKKALIRSVLDESAEFAIINAYNKHVLKVKVDTTAVNEYKEYLQFTEDVDAMLVSIFSTPVNE